MRSQVFVLAIAALALAPFDLAAYAQGTAARLLFFNVKPGAKAQFEDAIQQQMSARRAQGTDWRWLTWEYLSGAVPRYCVASFGHDWADFDQIASVAQAEEGRTAGAAALSSKPPVAQYFEHLDEISDFGTSTNVPTLAEVSLYELHYGKKAQFYAALREFHDAITQAGTGQRFEWFELRSGGNTPQFMLLVPRQNWAAFDVAGGELQAHLEKALGKRKANRVFEQFTSAIKSHQRSTVRLRPDLSLLSTGGTPQK